MTNATNNVARVAAAFAGFGLVAMSFAPLAGAQTTTTTTTTTSAASTLTFTRDLTIGSTGADVTSLQTWLIGKGFSIPAGATGYFGAQTKAALGSYQASVAITPAVGYFGPITRAYVNVHASEGTTTTGLPAGCTSTAGYSSTTGVKCSDGSSTTTTGGLTGGEAQLRNYSLLSGDYVAQGDSNKEIALARFDVRNGDVRVQRVTVEFQPQSSNTAINKSPWQYIDSLSVYSGSKKVGSVSASSKSAYDRQTAGSGKDFTSGQDFYSIDISLDTVVREGDTAELSVRADAVSNISDADAAAQSFKLKIPTNGIRAVDAKGIQQYVGDGSTVTVGFNSSVNGNLVVTATSANPSAGVLVADDQNTSDSFDVLAFQIRNKDKTDVDMNKLTFSVATTSAATSTGASSIVNIVRRATLDLDGDTYTGTVNSNNTIVFDNLSTMVDADSTIKGVVSVTLFGSNNHFATSGESIAVTLTGSTTYVDAESATTGDTSSVSGSAVGKTQSIGVNVGINASGTSNTTSESYNSSAPTTSTGAFSITFKVSASGNDVYIPKSIAAVSSSTASSNTTSGVVVITDLAGSTTNATSVSASLNSSAQTDPSNSSFYVIHDGSTETFTANVTIDPLVAGYYQVGIDRIHFTDVAAGTGTLSTLDVDQSQSEFQTNQLYIH